MTVKPGDNLQAALSAGGSIQFAAGTFVVTTPLTISSNTTLIGTPGLASHIVYNGPSNSALFVVAGNATNVTIQGLDIVSNGGVVKMFDGSGYSHIHIVANDIQYTSGAAFPGGQEVMAITDTVPCNDLQITHNYFHDDAGGGRNWYVDGPTNSNFDYNLFYNINDGGQVNDSGANVSISYNYGTKLRRMGQETASHDASSLTINGNVFYGWASVSTSSFGLSICTTPPGGPTTGKNSLTMHGNIIQLIGNGTAGNCIEAGAGNANISNNITGSNCTPNGQIVVMMANQRGSGNKSYGPNGATINSENGPIGRGSWGGSPVTYDPNLADMPAPPPNTFAGPAFYGVTPAPPAPASPPSPAAPAPSPAVPTLVHTIQTYSDGSVKVV